MNLRARREYARLLAGMEYPCWLVTLTRGHCIDLTLRAHAWHVLLTRLRQACANVQALTVYEYGPKRGVRLHIIIKGAPGLTQDWLNRMMSLLGDGTEAHLKPVYDSEGAAHYLTKTLPKLADPEYFRQWPPHFRPISVTRGWCPDWVSDRPSSVAPRRPSPRKNSARRQAPRADAGENGTPNDEMDEPQ